MITLYKKLKDPISGLTHLLGVFFSIAGLIYLVQRAVNEGTVWHIVSFAIFGTSLILLYTSSTIYHLVPLSTEKELLIRRIDHTLIFVLIAGSYTPYCLIPLRGPWGWSLFGVVWGLAIIGLFFSIKYSHSPRWIRTSLYLGMGWIAVIAFYPITQTVSATSILWLVIGGLAYSLGAVVYAIKKPDPFPGVFGFHEIWHLFVMAGSASHFISVAYLF